ncbi:MAG: TIGR00341 family protein [Methanosarcinales archaeon]|nr:TIGR00341 family protein [Methanosarcinales archaeon]
MKKVIVTAKKEDLEKIEAVTKDVLHFSKKEDDLIRVTIYIHNKELDCIIGKLRDAIDSRYRESIIEVYTPDFIISSVLKRGEKKVEKAKEITPVEKLIDTTRPHLRLDLSKLALTTIAGIIALMGLFLNNVAIIIGAMLLSPLLGPIYAFTINTAVGKTKDALKSVGNLGIQLLMVIILSALVTLVISLFIDLSLTSEILLRMNPSFIYILMALLLGFASILALSKGITEIIAGVAIAAALLPPAVVTGITIVLYPHQTPSPLALTLENVLGLMAGSLSATLILDISPRRYYERVVARKFIARISLVLIILLALLFTSSLLL